MILFMEGKRSGLILKLLLTKESKMMTQGLESQSGEREGRGSHVCYLHFRTI